MSANNQTLIAKDALGGGYLVFANVNAESWSDDNELHVCQSCGRHPTLIMAVSHAQDLEEAAPTEYGLEIDKLAKDGAHVKLISDAPATT